MITSILDSFTADTESIRKKIRPVKLIANKKIMQGQVTMFDLGNTEEEKVENMKYKFNTLKEFKEKELLSMEKEMLGIYISGHPLEKLKEKILKASTINTMQMLKIKEENNLNLDGKQVKYIGIVNSVKKKYTKKNTLMAFVTVEDLYGSTEVIVFESCYQKSVNYLLEDNIVLVTGRLSIKEETNISIVANDVTELKSKEKKILSLDITGIDEETKAKLRGAIRFFSGERNNIPINIIDGEEVKPCGGIFINGNTIQQFKDILGEERVKI